MLLRALFFLALIGSSALADTVTVRNDGGGNVSTYVERREKLAKVGSVRIEGKCLSSCTIFTTLPNACVMANAKLGFHGTSPRVPLFQRILDKRLGNYYRGEVKRLYLKEWRFLRGTEQMYVITGAQLKRLDPLIKLCAK